MASHVVVETGSSPIAQLTEWLDTADAYLRGAHDDAEGLIGAAMGLAVPPAKSRSVSDSVQEMTLDLITMPLRAQTDVARATLAAIQQSVEAAQRVTESVDATRC